MPRRREDREEEGKGGRTQEEGSACAPYRLNKLLARRMLAYLLDAGAQTYVASSVTYVAPRAHAERWRGRGFWQTTHTIQRYSMGMATAVSVSTLGLSFISS